MKEQPFNPLNKQVKVNQLVNNDFILANIAQTIVALFTDMKEEETRDNTIIIGVQELSEELCNACYNNAVKEQVVSARNIKYIFEDGSVIKLQIY